MSYESTTSNFTGTLPPHCLKQLEAIQSIRYYKDGEVIHERGDRGAGLSVILKGAVKMGNYGLDGRYFLTKVMQPGETYGEFVLFAKLHRTHTAEAVGDTEIGYIEKHALEKALRNSPELAMQLLISLSSRLHNATEILDDSKRLPIPARLAKLLLTVAQDLQPLDGLEGAIVLELTQDNLAAQMGVSRMSISKALKELTSSGFIDQGYQAITITDIAALRTWYKEQNQTMPLKKLNEGKKS